MCLLIRACPPLGYKALTFQGDGVFDDFSFVSCNVFAIDDKNDSGCDRIFSPTFQ